MNYQIFFHANRSLCILFTCNNTTYPFKLGQQQKYIETTGDTLNNYLKHRNPKETFNKQSIKVCATISGAQQEGGGGGLHILFFENQKECTDFRKKGLDCVHLGLNFLIKI